MKRPVMTPADGLALVTGASSGIGRELALQMARAGWTVGAFARREEALTALADEAAAGPGRIIALPGDATSDDDVALAAETLKSHGPVALMILNAGVYLPMEAPDVKAAIMEKSCAVNLVGTVRWLEALLPDMAARRTGRVQIISSATAYGGMPTAAAYGATKAALVNMAEALRMELDRHGVTVQVICPGFVETPAQDDNDFPKPFIMSAEEAAARIVKAGRSGAMEVSFPRRFTWMLKAIYALPRAVHVPLVKRFTGWHKPLEADAG